MQEKSFQELSRTSKKTGFIAIPLLLLLIVPIFVVMSALTNSAKNSQGPGPVAPQDTNSTLGQNTDQNAAASGSMSVNNQCGISVVCVIGDQSQAVGVANTNGAYQTTMGDCNGSFTPDYGDTSSNPKGTCMPKAQVQGAGQNAEDSGVLPGLAKILGVPSGIFSLFAGLVVIFVLYMIFTSLRRGRT